MARDRERQRYKQTKGWKFIKFNLRIFSWDLLEVKYQYKIEKDKLFKITTTFIYKISDKMNEKISVL